MPGPLVSARARGLYPAPKIACRRPRTGLRNL